MSIQRASQLMGFPNLHRCLEILLSAFAEPIFRFVKVNMFIPESLLKLWEGVDRAISCWLAESLVGYGIASWSGDTDYDDFKEDMTLRDSETETRRTSNAKQGVRNEWTAKAGEEGRKAGLRYVVDRKTASSLSVK